MNSKAVRFIVIAEVLVCFVPLGVLWLLGFLLMPFALEGMLYGHFEGTMSVVSVVCGVAGLVALVQVLKWIFGRRTNVLGRWWTLALMFVGVLPVALIFVDSITDVVVGRRRTYGMIPVWAAPILVTAHLAYLARKYLFTSTGNRVNP